MKKMTGCFLLFFLLSGVSAEAGCRVFVPEKEFLHDSGYSIRFDFSSVLNSKKYEEVYDPSLADFVLSISGSEIEGRLHRAEARIKMGDLEVSKRRLCLTQFCGISDYAKSFSKAYREFSRSLPVCTL